MKILAIGGSGGMGRFAVRTSQGFSNITSLVVADLNSIEAKTFASSLGSKVTGIGLDVLDSNALIKAMQDVDVVLNTSGPFFKLGVPILEAAMKSISPEPVVKDLAASVDSIREKELKKALAKLGLKDKKRIQIIEELTKSVVDNIVSVPTKVQTNTPEQESK